MSDLGGFSKGDKAFYITHIPDRKKPVLLVGNKYCAQKIATFDSEECAEGFLRLMEDFLNCYRKEDTE